MSYDPNIDLREWQKKAKQNIKNAINSDKNELVAVNACVGSGKTNVAFNAFIDYIEANPGKKSVQLFVAPRIRLCNQQKEDFENDYAAYIKKYHIRVAEKNCQGDDRNWDNLFNDGGTKENPYEHYVVFIVDESLWGEYQRIGKDGEKRTATRMDDTLKVLSDLKKKGFSFGVIAYDEAHNYDNNQKKMFGKKEFLEVN